MNCEAVWTLPLNADLTPSNVKLVKCYMNILDFWHQLISNKSCQKYFKVLNSNTYLAHFNKSTKHHNKRDIEILDQRPKITDCGRQRSLSSNKTKYGILIIHFAFALRTLTSFRPLAAHERHLCNLPCSPWGRPTWAQHGSRHLNNKNKLHYEINKSQFNKKHWHGKISLYRFLW